MDKTAQTSFIPKKPQEEPSRTRSGGGVVFLFTLLVFLLTVLSAGATFLWNRQITSQNDKYRAQLEQRRSDNASYLDDIKSLKRLNQRVTEARKILDAHVSLSSLFDLLEGATLQSIQLASFEFKLSETGGPATFSVNGSASSYESIAYQSQVFSGVSGIREPVFSDLVVDPKGKIGFRLSALVDAGTINYGRTLTERGVPASSDLPTSAPPGEVF